MKPRKPSEPSKAPKPAHPIQPLVVDVHGVMRFRVNAIVKYLLDRSGTGSKFDMNALGAMPFSDEDRQQFAQLIGYSLSGYSELSYVDDLAYAAAMRSGDGMGSTAARLAVVTEALDAVKDALRPAVSALYGIHEDDLT